MNTDKWILKYRTLTAVDSPSSTYCSYSQTHQQQGTYLVLSDHVNIGKGYLSFINDDDLLFVGKNEIFSVAMDLGYYSYFKTSNYDFLA